MPPKIRITKDDIVKTAVDIVRREGDTALNARRIAGELNCSTQPVFSNFRTMEELHAAVVKAAADLYAEYAKTETDTGKYPAYKALGMAYIRFAAAERELFRLLFMRPRSTQEIEEKNTAVEPVFAMVRDTTGIAGNEAERFHLEMWSCVHGFAVMLATGYLPLDEALISGMMTDVFVGLKKRYEEGV